MDVRHLHACRQALYHQDIRAQRSLRCSTVTAMLNGHWHPSLTLHSVTRGTRTFTVHLFPSPLSKKFSGFRSLCTKDRACKYATPQAPCEKKNHITISAFYPTHIKYIQQLQHCTFPGGCAHVLPPNCAGSKVVGKSKQHEKLNIEYFQFWSNTDRAFNSRAMRVVLSIPGHYG